MIEPLPAADAPPAVPPRRRPWRSIVVILLAAALTAGGFWFLTRPRGPDVALALGFEEGDTYRYRLTMVTDGTIDTALVDLPMDGDVTQTVTYHVVEVAADGAATIEVGIDEVKGSFAGQEIPVTEQMRVRMVIGPDGELREVDGRPVPEALQQGWADPTGAGGLPGMQSFPLLPDGPVGPGDEWVKEVVHPLPFGDGEVRLHAENEFVRYDDIGQVRAAVIESEITSPIDWTIDVAELAELGKQFDGSGEGFAEIEEMPTTIAYRGQVLQDQTTWLDPDRGEMVRSELSGEFDITTRTRGGRGIGALVSAVPVRMYGEMQVTMERIGA